MVAAIELRCTWTREHFYDCIAKALVSRYSTSSSVEERNRLEVLYSDNECDDKPCNEIMDIVHRHEM